MLSQLFVGLRFGVRRFARLTFGLRTFNKIAKLNPLRFGYYTVVARLIVLG